MWPFTKRKCAQCAEYKNVMAELRKLEMCMDENKYSTFAQFGGAAVKIFAASMVNWFKETGGKNYVTVEMHDPDTGERYELTMQKAGAKTPGDKIRELEATITELRRGAQGSAP
jgi:hypothetical protein